MRQSTTARGGKPRGGPAPRPLRCRCGDPLVLVGGPRPLACPSCTRFAPTPAARRGDRR